MEKDREIAEDYQEFYRVAEELARGELKDHPLDKRESLWDRLSRHLIGMLEMYSVRYGDPEERLRVVDFLEKQIFGKEVDSFKVSSLSMVTWRRLRHTILSGEYKDLAGEEE